ncbi:MAG: hypothetical protein A2007_04160 [Verrucomicrobia bacterium GWC2_42_7]|nr:MAG: hypothetical protein A2007_04160 [Verrucomicrobia bacterium GWC2_42_7]
MGKTHFGHPKWVSPSPFPKRSYLRESKFLTKFTFAQTKLYSLLKNRSDKVRKPFFSQEKKSFRAFQRKANIAEEKIFNFSSARGMKL